MVEDAMKSIADAGTKVIVAGGTVSATVKRMGGPVDCVVGGAVQRKRVAL